MEIYFGKFSGMWARSSAPETEEKLCGHQTHLRLRESVSTLFGTADILLQPVTKDRRTNIFTVSTRRFGGKHN